MNEFMVYGELRQRADIFLPFDIRQQLNYFVSKDEFNVYRSAAPLASNLYTPFSYKKVSASIKLGHALFELCTEHEAFRVE